MFKPAFPALLADLHCQNPRIGSQESTHSVYPELPCQEFPLITPGYRGHAEHGQFGLRSWQLQQSRPTAIGADCLLPTHATLPGFPAPTFSRRAVEARVAGSPSP